MMATRRIRTLSRTFLVVASAVLVAACGGGDDDGSSGNDEGDAKTPTGEADGDAEAGGGEGKSIFVDTCGSCHTLSDAGTSGAVGPNLDDAKPDAERVKEMIDNGGGAMPAGLLEGEERDVVAEYVAGAAGG